MTDRHTDRQYRQENRREQHSTKQNRKEKSTAQQQRHVFARVFFLPSFARAGLRGFQLLLFQIHANVYVCVSYLSYPGEREISHVARPVGSLVFFFGVCFSRT